MRKNPAKEPVSHGRRLALGWCIAEKRVEKDEYMGKLWNKKQKNYTGKQKSME